MYIVVDQRTDVLDDERGTARMVYALSLDTICSMLFATFSSGKAIQFSRSFSVFLSTNHSFRQAHKRSSACIRDSSEPYECLLSRLSPITRAVGLLLWIEKHSIYLKMITFEAIRLHSLWLSVISKTPCSLGLFAITLTDNETSHSTIPAFNPRSSTYFRYYCFWPSTI